MKFAPETVRLRRAARAHAVGEFSLSEYRQTRREVIDNFEGVQPGDDDTRPRRQEPSAVPRSRRPDVAVPAAPTRAGRGWLRWVVAALAVLVAAKLFADPLPVDQRNAAIPPVADRDPNPATSPRLAVSTVVVEVPAAELEVAAEELQTIAERHIEEIRRRNRPGGHGFTRAELEEVGRFLNALGAHEEGGELDRQDAADLSALLKEQKSRRGISVVELEEVAAAVQARLRESGHLLAVAYLPAQAVADGTVTIGVLPGVLGVVEIDGADQRLARGFDDLLGQPVTEKEISTRLYALNQSPGFTARASFEPGERTGESRLKLEVLERRSLRGDVALDNHGDGHTGRQRLLLGGDLINPTGRGDVLRLGLLTALDPSNQLLGRADYATPLGGRRQLRARLARNDFNTSGSDPVYGDGWLFDGMLETFVHRSRLTGLSYELGIGRHSLNWDTATGSVDQTATLARAALNGRRVWDELEVATDFRLYADLGAVDGDLFAGQDESFWDVGLELFAWHPFDLEWLPGRQKASLELRGQLSDMQLPASRRFALGGAHGARGFERDLFLADSGLLVRTDLRTPLPLGELSLFLDTAYGKSRNELTPEWAHVANLGIGWDVRFSRYLLSSLSWAVPVTAKGTGDVEDDGSKLFWSLRYTR